LRVWQIGQQQTQYTTQLVNLATIDQLIQNIQLRKQLTMLSMSCVLQNAASENIKLGADQA